MKTFFVPLSTAWTAVITHKLRSFLTILGVVIGVAAVIILMSVGRGTEQQILSSLSSLGANMITIRPGSTSQGGVRGGFGSASTLTLEDARAIAMDVTNINGVAPTSMTGMQVIAGNQNMSVMITGITPSYQDINEVMLSSGDYITVDAYERASKVALIGQAVSQTLFLENDPVGEKIRMGNTVFTVIGLLEHKGEGFFSSDNYIYIPLSTLQGIMARSVTTSGEHTVNSITVQAVDEKSIDSVKEQITAILQERHHIAFGAENDFSITSTDEITDTITTSMQSMTILLGAIAGISLLVGGIGVMNIMLVSVMERRREIGIRKALGAKERDIWGQFLLDAALLTFAGGIIGVAIGWAGSYMIGQTGAVSTLVTSDTVLLAVGVSVGIGLFFGFYPAWQGSRLDPIQALRSE
ncbi:MAG: ABC transporter permease [Dehalococcoidales bacterium]|nr:ABC transporter permease [Dehalococcoidales bacterium]